jgi:hypothetical protein
VADGLIARAAAAGAFLAAANDAQPLLLAHHVPVLRELSQRALRLFAALLLVHKRGHDSVLLTHADVATAVTASESSARRAMGELLHAGYVAVVAPAFVPNDPALGRELALARKAPHSRRGNVYAVPDAVLGGIRRVRSSLVKLEQASGTASEQEHELSGSSQPPGGRARPEPAALVQALCPVAPCGQTEPASPVSVSAAPTKIDCLAARRSAPAVGPGTRQAETRSTSPEGLGGDGFDELRSLAASGDTFAAELLAQIDRDRQRRSRFGSVPKDPELARDLTWRARAEKDDGDATN